VTLDGQSVLNGTEIDTAHAWEVCTFSVVCPVENRLLCNGVRYTNLAYDITVFLKIVITVLLTFINQEASLLSLFVNFWACN
jgi:hypothetical protein